VGGEADLTQRQCKPIDLAARASLLLDHVDAWLFQQPRLVNARTKTLLPILVQRQTLADHLTRLLDKLPVMPEHAPPGGINVQRAVVLLPDKPPRPTLVRRHDDGAAFRASVTRTPVAVADRHRRASRSQRAVTDQPHDGAEQRRPRTRPGAHLTRCRAQGHRVGSAADGKAELAPRQLTTRPAPV